MSSTNFNDPIYGYKKTSSNSFSAFRNTCEYACALDIQEKKLGYGKLLQYLIAACAVVVLVYFWRG